MTSMIKTNITSSTGLKRENTLHQYGYTLPIGFSVMGNYTPISFFILSSYNRGYHAIVFPTQEAMTSHCYTLPENKHTCTMFYNFFGQMYYYTDEMDEVGEEDGKHYVSWRELHSGDQDLFTLSTTRSWFTGNIYYQAPLTMLADDAKGHKFSDFGFGKPRPYLSEVPEKPVKYKQPKKRKSLMFHKVHRDTDKRYTGLPKTCGSRHVMIKPNGECVFCEHGH